MIGALLSVEIQDLPLPFRKRGFIIQDLQIRQGSGDDSADIEGLLRLALSCRCAEVAKRADDGSVYLDDHGGSDELVAYVNEYLFPNLVEVFAGDS